MKQRVLVTAGGSGIGLAIANCFLEDGARVHVCDVDPATIGDLEMTAPGATGSLADVGDPDQVTALYQEAVACMGGVDVLVNNAGIGGGHAWIEDVDTEAWLKCIQVNLSGAFFMLRAVVPEMKARGSGSIINISTMSAKTGLPERTPYVASKCGMLGLSHNAARELGPHGIRVNAILPGMIDNARGAALIEKAAAESGGDLETTKSRFLSYISMRTMIHPREVGDMCVFLASDRAKHITAQEIAVDGNLEWER